MLEYAPPKLPETKAQWARKKAAFAKKLARLLGEKPRRVPLGPETVEERSYPKFTRYKVTYAVEAGERVPAYLFIPKGPARPRPVVLCLHQHAGQFGLGKSEVAGRIGNPLQATAPELAERGFIALAPDSIGFEERLRYWNGDVNESDRLVMAGRTYAAKVIWDIGCAIDFLETVSCADTARIGAIGHSMGAMHVLAAMAVEKRIKVGVSSCGMHVMRNMQERADDWPMTYFIPGLAAGRDDLDVLYALIAPRPLMVFAAELDGTVRAADYRAAIPYVKRAYRLEGASGNLRAVLVKGRGHGLYPEMKAAAYRFLAHHLA